MVAANPSRETDHSFEGMWWRHDPGVSGFVAISNTANGVREVSLRAEGSEGTPLGEQTVELAGHSTRMFDLDQILIGLPTNENDAGGIRVVFNGASTDVSVSGGLENRQKGYSAAMPFYLRAPASASAQQYQIASVGIMDGQPDPVLGFPSTTHFGTYLVLRNTTDISMALRPTVDYMNGAQPQTLNLPVVKLAAHQSKQVPLDALLRSGGLGSYDGLMTLVLPFSGKVGDLVIATGSVDQTGTFVFSSLPQGVGPSVGRQESLFWSVADGSDTMYTLWNSGGTAEDLVATFTFAQAGKIRTYELPVHLPPGASEMLDLVQVIKMHLPDPNGNFFPTDATEGGASFFGAGGRTQAVNLNVAAGVYNVHTATCGLHCTQCSGAVSGEILPTPIDLATGGTAQVAAMQTFSDGAKFNVSNAKWSSSNTAVATVSAGLVSAVGVGSCDISASWSSELSIEDCGAPIPPCPVFTESGGGSANVASLTVHFTGGKTAGDTLTFAGTQACTETLGPADCTSSTGAWVWNVEVAGNVPDDASKWTVTQTENGLTKGNWIDPEGGLHAFSNPSSVSNDAPLPQFLQQTAGQKLIFWLDAPGTNILIAPGEPIDSMVSVKNFTSTICSTSDASDCVSVSWFTKLVVNSPAVLSPAQSTAAFGSLSLNF